MSWEQAVGTTGKVVQGLASFLIPGVYAKELRKANDNARRTMTEGYDEAGNKLSAGYAQGRGDITQGANQGIGALQEGYAGAEQAQQPFYQAGAQGLNTLRNMGQFSFDQQDMQNDPGYQFRLQQGQDSIQSGAAARGGLLSGATQKALSRYGQEFASNEYNNAYNRAQNTYGTNFQTANTLAGYGQNAANQIGSYRTGLGTGSALMYGNAGANLGQMANQYGQNSANMQVGRAGELANLQLQRGQINANQYQGYGNAIQNAGKYIQEIGGGIFGDKSQMGNDFGTSVSRMA